MYHVPPQFLFVSWNAAFSLSFLIPSSCNCYFVRISLNLNPRLLLAVQLIFLMNSIFLLVTIFTISLSPSPPHNPVIVHLWGIIQSRVHISCLCQIALCVTDWVEPLYWLWRYLLPGTTYFMEVGHTHLFFSLGVDHPQSLCIIDHFLLENFVSHCVACFLSLFQLCILVPII